MSLHTSAGLLEGLSLAANVDRWALTFAYAPPDGAAERTYLVVLGGDGALVAGPRPVEPYARVAALDGGFLLVGPSLSAPVFAALDAGGRETERLEQVPDELGQTPIGKLVSQVDAVLGLAGTRVFRVTSGDAGLSVALEVDLAQAGVSLTDGLGVASGRALAWESAAAGGIELVWGGDGVLGDPLRVAGGSGLPDEVGAAAWLPELGEWWATGSYFGPDGRTRIGTLMRVRESGTPVSVVELETAGYPAAIAVAPRPALLYPRTLSIFEPESALVGSVALDLDNRAAALLAWNDERGRYAVAGRRGYTFAVRCDLTQDAAPLSIPTPSFEAPDLPANDLPASSGPCAPDNPIVAAVANEGLTLHKLAAAGDAFAVHYFSPGKSALLIVDREGSTRSAASNVLDVAAFGNGFLIARRDAIAMLDTSGAVLAETSSPGGAEFERLVTTPQALAATGMLDRNPQLFPLRWSPAQKTLALGAHYALPDDGNSTELGFDGERMLSYDYAGEVTEHVRSGTTWARRTFPTSLPCASCSAVYHRGQRRWWIAGSRRVDGTPYVRGEIVRLDPETGAVETYAIDTPPTREFPTVALGIEPELPAGRREAMLFGERFFGVSPIGRPVERWFGPGPARIASDPVTGTWAVAVASGLVVQPVNLGAAGWTSRDWEHWVEIYCGFE